MGKQGRAKRDAFVESYKRVRKPMPPPEQVIADKRRRTEEDDARREIEEVASERSDRKRR